MPRTVTTSVSVLKSTANGNGAGRQDLRKGQGDLQNRGLKTSSSVVVPEDHFSLIRGSGHRLGHENRAEMSATRRRSNSRDKGAKNGSRGSSSRKNEEETKRSDRPDRRHHQQRSNQQSSSAQSLNQAGNEEDSNQRPPLIEYFKNDGVDLKRIYKRTKIELVVKEQGGLRSQVYLAGLSYPEGYGSDDLPDSQDFLSQSTEEQPLSPAVLLAANNRRREVLISSPSISSDDIIRNLRMGRNSNNGNPAPPAVEPRTPENVPEQPENASINGSFPDDSFNDSMIIMASQQVEDCLAAEAAEQKGDKRKRDFNGNNTGPAASPDIFETSAAPITSTPLTSVTMSQRRTSQTCSPRCRRVGLSRNRNKSGTPKSLFENSILESPSPIKRIEHVDNNNDEIEEQQRKFPKLDESPIKPVDQHGVSAGSNISGEFEDDDNDDIFSQIPDEVMLPPLNTKNKIRKSQPSKVDKSNKTDDWMEDSLDNMNESELAALEKFEAMHCNSTGSSNSSSNATPNANKPILRSYVGSQTPVTNTKPTPKARRMGLNKSRSKK